MSMLDKSKCLEEEEGDLLLSMGLNKEETYKYCKLVAEPRFKQVISGQLELAGSDIEATQFRPCRDKCWTTWGAAMLGTILCQDLHTILGVACRGVGSICMMGSMISSDWVREKLVK